MLHEDVDDGLGIVHEVIGIEFEFFEFGILANEIFNGVFEGFDNPRELGLIGWSFNVEDDFVLDSQFPGDRQGMIGRASTFEVIDADFGHEGEVAAEWGWSRG